MRTMLPLVLAGIVCSLACSGGPQPPPFRPVADVKQLMQGAIDPSADVLWEATGEIITLEGTTRRRPKNDEEWAQVRNAAIVLTE